eukprot:Skav219724  [mRNA]  locus=scaffold301:153234:153485:- [translate_table: standard]
MPGKRATDFQQSTQCKAKDPKPSSDARLVASAALHCATDPWVSCTLAWNPTAQLSTLEVPSSWQHDSVNDSAIQWSSGISSST